MPGPEDRIDAFTAAGHHDGASKEDARPSVKPAAGLEADAQPEEKEPARAARSDARRSRTKQTGTTRAGAGPDGGGRDGTASSGAKPAPADIGALGLLRWAWRQLTTMRVALMLLLLLALAAVPGSLFPQRIQDPALVAQYIEDNGVVGEWLDRLQLFDVYGSIWFSAVYILLMVSLIGCILPRTKVHWQAMRARPPKAPRRFSRMPAHREESLDRDPDAILDAAEKVLKRRGYRTVRRDDHIAAERGYLRETGNLVFHVAILGIVVSVALGGLLGWSGQRILVEGQSFSNSLVSYDSFEAGTYFDPDRLDGFQFRLDSFSAAFDTEAQGNQFGQPRDFTGLVTTTVDGEEQQHILRVNEPVRLDDARVYLVGNGYAPVVTVRDGNGEVAFSEPVVFLPEGDSGYTMRGVVKVPDAAPEQLGFVGILLPTAGEDPESGELISTFADLVNPYMVMSAYAGDLGLDTGESQSVYSLDPSNMRELQGSDGEPITLQLAPGETQELPDGLGSVTFDGVKRYVALDIRHDPVQGVALVFSILAFLGLAASLFVPRRRAWIRVGGGEDAEGPAKVELAALARGDDPRLGQEIARLAVELSAVFERSSPEAERPPRSG